MPNKITTGTPVIDELIDSLRWGDNVVWRVTNTLEYSWLVRSFVESAVKNGIDIIYVHFDEYAIPGIPENCKTVNIDPSQRFDYFYHFVQELMESSGKKYIMFLTISPSWQETGEVMSRWPISFERPAPVCLN